MQHAEASCENLYEFVIPKSQLYDSVNRGPAQQFVDYLYGTNSIGMEWRFFGDASYDLNMYLIR
jgi:hypothetical protein